MEQPMQFIFKTRAKVSENANLRDAQRRYYEKVKDRKKELLQLWRAKNKDRVNAYQNAMNKKKRDEKRIVAE